MESFVNEDSLYSCGRPKTEVFKYDDVMLRFNTRSSAHTIRKGYMWSQIQFKYGEKISGFENTRLSVNGRKVDAGFF